jgi:tRNA threonylcarbamoyladenosine biosynthesis protein TsaB
LGRSLTGPVLVFGEGWTVESSAIRASIHPYATVAEAPEAAMKPSAISIGLAGIERLRRGEYAETGISPLYVQRTAAELKYEESGGLSPVALRQERVARKVNARVSAAGIPSTRARVTREGRTGRTRDGA